MHTIPFGAPYRYGNILGRVIGMDGGTVHFATPHGTLMKVGLLWFIRDSVSLLSSPTAVEPLTHMEAVATAAGKPLYGLPDFRNRIKMLVMGEQPYIETTRVVVERKYNPNYGDGRICVCGHKYYRHFDTYDQMEACGCKYCQCVTFKEQEHGQVGMGSGREAGSSG